MGEAVGLVVEVDSAAVVGAGGGEAGLCVVVELEGAAEAVVAGDQAGRGVVAGDRCEAAGEAVVVADLPLAVVEAAEREAMERDKVRLGGGGERELRARGRPRRDR